MKSFRERERLATHIIVRDSEDGSRLFLNDVEGGWSKDRFLAVQLSEFRAAKIARKVGGKAIPRS